MIRPTSPYNKAALESTHRSDATSIELPLYDGGPAYVAGSTGIRPANHFNNVSSSAGTRLATAASALRSEAAAAAAAVSLGPEAAAAAPRVTGMVKD